MRIVHCLILCTLASLSLAPPTARAAPFAAPSDGFAMRLPPGWIQIPQAAIAEVKQELERQSPTVKLPHYNFAFQFGSPDEWFTYPYVVIQVKRTGRISEAQLSKLDKLSTDDASKSLQDKARSLMTEIEIGKMRYDPVSRIIWTNIGANVTEVGRVSGISAAVPTEYGLLQISGFAKEREFMAFLLVFHELIASVEVDERVKYQLRQAEKPSFLSSVDWKSILGYAITGAVIAGVAAFTSKRRRK